MSNASGMLWIIDLVSLAPLAGWWAVRYETWMWPTFKEHWLWLPFNRSEVRLKGKDTLIFGGKVFLCLKIILIYLSFICNCFRNSRGWGTLDNWTKIELNFKLFSIIGVSTLWQILMKNLLYYNSQHSSVVKAFSKCLNLFCLMVVYTKANMCGY